MSALRDETFGTKINSNTLTRSIFNVVNQEVKLFFPWGHERNYFMVAKQLKGTILRTLRQ